MEKQPKQFTKGLFTDTNEEFQPEGTYRFMLNGILESEDGDRGSVSNELGNELCFTLDEEYLNSNFSLIGTCLLSDNRIVLFLTDDTTSIIGIQNTNCTFEVIVNNDCLNFKSCKPIDAIFKLHNGCDYYVYFTDEFNKYRSISIDNISKYSPLGTFDCGLIAISPDYIIPDIYLNRIVNSGRLKLGAYQFTLRYLDEDLNPTNWTFITNPIYINQPTEAVFDLVNNNGGFLGSPDSDGFYYVNKSIELQLVNLDLRYKYYQLGVIESAQGTIEISNGYILTPNTISDSSDTFLFSTLSVLGGTIGTDASELIVPNLYINVIKAHTQIENRLILGNHEEAVKDWSEFQRAANDIDVQYFTYIGDDIAETDVNSCEYEIGATGARFIPELIKNHSNAIVTFDNKSYMRDEVYALGIVYVFNDGSESPVMHIPGRIKIGTPSNVNDTSTATSLTINGYVYDSTAGWTYWNGLGDTYNIDPGPPVPDEWDTKTYNLSTDVLIFIDPSSPSPKYSPTEIASCENVYTDEFCDGFTDLPRWKHVNTSIKEVAPDLTDFEDYKHLYTVEELGIMGYYETDTTYPEIKDCNGVPIFPHDDLGGGMYRMHNIRHHLIPDARKVPITNMEEGIDVQEYEMRLYNMGIKVSNVSIPVAFQNDIQGYYIVRSDRAGNKTVIDKGWMNVCDTTWGHNLSDAIVELHDGIPSTGTNCFTDYCEVDNQKTIEQNTWFMTPGFKNGYGPITTSNCCECGHPPATTQKGYKQPQKSGFNIVEFFSPKSSFNDIVNLAGDYYKLENTLYGRFTFEGKEDWISTKGLSLTCKDYKLSMYSYLIYNKLPEIYNFTNRETWFLAYKLPIDGSEYTLYNENNISTIATGFKLLNDSHRQTIMLSKLFKSDVTPDTTNYCYFQKPRQTAVYDLNNLSPTYGNILSGFEDIIPWGDSLNTVTPPGIGDAPNLWLLTNQYWIEEGQKDHGNIPDPNIGEQFNEVFGNVYFSPFLYYAALKANITPYRKLEKIKYVRTTNYIIEPNNTHYGIAGGDTFIARQQMIKTFVKSNTCSKDELGGSLMWGFVESEINSHYRHKEAGDDYYAYPWNTINESIYEVLLDLKGLEDDEDCTPLVTRSEQRYNYRLDYSKDNNDRVYFPLADEFEYCSDCSGKFPHTLYFSEVSFPDEIQDFYRQFKINNNRNIPSDTGEITNIIVKEEQLFTFTSGNLWKFNVSPQQLKTNNDTIQVGQGDFLSLRPTKVFDNKQGLNRGGLQYKFSGSFCDDSYIWADTMTGKIYRLQGGVKELSIIGMRRFFENNIEGLKLQDEFYNLPFNGSTTGKLKYPYLSTTCAKGIGYYSVYDPQYMRYILTKKDYSIIDYEVLEELPVAAPYDLNTVYYNEEGFWLATDVNTVELVDNLDSLRNILEPVGFTISYSLLDNVWVSYHSYLPTIMYNDSNDFYSYYANNNEIVNNTYKHNVGKFQTYGNIKFPFIIDYINNTTPYVENTYDTVEYTSNVFSYSNNNKQWIDVPFVTFDTVYVYNNNQISNLKSIIVSNSLAYKHTQYNVGEVHAHKQRNYWRINKFRDYAVDRNLLTESLFTKNWSDNNYSNKFVASGLGWIDKVINNNSIDSNKNPYKLTRFTDKFFGVRLSFNPQEDYKINFNLSANLKRNKL